MNYVANDTGFKFTDLCVDASFAPEGMRSHQGLVILLSEIYMIPIYSIYNFRSPWLGIFLYAIL